MNTRGMLAGAAVSVGGFGLAGASFGAQRATPGIDADGGIPSQVFTNGVLNNIGISAAAVGAMALFAPAAHSGVALAATGVAAIAASVLSFRHFSPHD